MLPDSSDRYAAIAGALALIAVVLGALGAVLLLTALALVAAGPLIRLLGDKVEASERADIEAAVADLKTAAEGDNVEVIQTKHAHLSELHAKLAERLYQQDDAAGAAPGGDDNGAAGGSAAGDDVVDAEFEEVKDESK